VKLRKSRSRRRGRIEIIPMIDVMFFLLVTFMLASLSMQSLNSITVNLPQGDAPNLQHKEPVALTITKDSKIFLDKTPTTLPTLAFTLKSMLQGADKGVVVNDGLDGELYGGWVSLSQVCVQDSWSPTCHAIPPIPPIELAPER